jgi:hypothetical protein
VLRLITSTERERQDARGDNDNDGTYDGNNQVIVSDSDAEAAAHDALASAMLRLSARIATLEAVLVLTSVPITGRVSRLWTEPLLFVALSAIYDEAKARSVFIASGTSRLAGNLDAEYASRYYTKNEQQMYWGEGFNKIHGQRNPNLDTPNFSTAEREGVGLRDLDHMIVSSVDRMERCPRAYPVYLTALKMKNGVTFGDLENLGGTDPSASSFFHPGNRFIRKFEVKHEEGTVGSFTSKVVSKGSPSALFNYVGTEVDLATAGVLIALKAAGLDVEKGFDQMSTLFNDVVMAGGSISDFFNIGTVDTNWLHTHSVEQALTRLQDHATEEYGGPFPLAYDYETKGTINRGARQGSTGQGVNVRGDYTYAQLIDKTGLTFLDSFRNHTWRGTAIDNTLVSYTPREEYNTRMYAGNRTNSLFGFDTLEYEFQGVNTEFAMAVDPASTYWRNASPTRIEPADGEGDAIALNGRLFAVYDYSGGPAQWKWVKGATSLIS